MATNKPRFSITVSDEMFNEINNYQHDNKLSTQTKAVTALIERGIEFLKSQDREISVKSTLVIPDSDLDINESKLIYMYRDLDDHGKEMVDMVLEKEYERCTPDQPDYQSKYQEISKAAGEKIKRKMRAQKVD